MLILRFAVTNEAKASKQQEMMDCSLFVPALADQGKDKIMCSETKDLRPLAVPMQFLSSWASLIPLEVLVQRPVEPAESVVHLIRPEVAWMLVVRRTVSYTACMIPVWYYSVIKIYEPLSLVLYQASCIHKFSITCQVRVCAHYSALEMHVSTGAHVKLIHIHNLKILVLDF